MALPVKVLTKIYIPPQWTMENALPNVVIRKSPSIFKLLPSKNESLLIGRDAFLVLDLRLDIIDRVGRLNFEGDGFASQCLNKDLHPTTEAENQVESRLLLNVVVAKSAAILELLASEDQSLLVGRDTKRQSLNI